MAENREQNSSLQKLIVLHGRFLDLSTGVLIKIKTTNLVMGLT